MKKLTKGQMKALELRSEIADYLAETLRFQKYAEGHFAALKHPSSEAEAAIKTARSRSYAALLFIRAAEHTYDLEGNTKGAKECRDKEREDFLLIQKELIQENWRELHPIKGESG